MPGTGDTPPIVAVVGCTASGKTGLSLDLAEALGGEIVNTDAMQVYRGMDIGTAKLPADQRRGIRHHLLDLLDVSEPLSVADFQVRARAAIKQLRDAGTTPVLVGGSALYTRAILDRFEFPGTEEGVRQRWEAELEAVGAGELHRRLAELDPDAAARILPDNGRRIVRALEVIELTGERFSANLPTPGPARYGTRLVGIDRDPAELDARVDARVQQMFTEGLVDEVRALAERGLRKGKTASRALGYQQVLAALDGDGDFAAAAEQTAQATRRFVRRQRSWFRRDGRITWFDAADPELADRVMDHLG
jgi:tRNA dimethylallyltransferase